MTGRLTWSMSGVTSSISSDNQSYTHYITNASAGHWFNKNVYVSGDVYGGTSYSRILAFKDEINSQVGGTKNSQMLWSSWNNSDVYGGAIQIREYGNVGNTQSDWYYSPAITFHWGNRAVKRFGMRSDGQFAIDNNPILWSGNYSSYALPLSGGKLTGNINMNDKFIMDSTGKSYPASTSLRSSGIYGVYDSVKIGHIWSMGTAYTIPDDGSTFGNLYGLAYKHTNNATGGTMAGGHQVVWVVNGSPRAALGELGV